MSSNQTSHPKGSDNKPSETDSAPAGGNKTPEKSSAQDNPGQISQSDESSTKYVPKLDEETEYTMKFREDKP
jgi:hypothetical protein